jgi:hypothetical protein
MMPSALVCFVWKTLIRARFSAARVHEVCEEEHGEVLQDSRPREMLRHLIRHGIQHPARHLVTSILSIPCPLPVPDADEKSRKVWLNLVS